jgi:ABC-2 type transport system permease protein
MNKLLAIIKREYVQRVRSKMFLVATILGPLMILVFAIVPAFVMQINAGGATRLAVVDQSGKMYERIRESLMQESDDEKEKAQKSASVNAAFKANTNDRVEAMGRATRTSYAVEQIQLNGQTLEEVRAQLNRRVHDDQLDGYLIIPADVLANGETEFLGRNKSDLITRSQIKDRLNSAVRDGRMAEHNIDRNLLREINQPVRMNATTLGEKGEVEASGNGFWFVFIMGFMIYITILMYGQAILGAVVEEKETRIAEVLFSSVRAFPLMLGKLIGVSLVALTQYAIWGIAFAIFALYGVNVLAARGINASMPTLQPLVILYFVLFFLLGYFIYATIYALVGSMVTTTQEGGQLALPVIFILIMGFYLAFPIIRSPNSPLAFWVSLVPFFSPITMMVRIVTQTPPFWQIALSLVIGYATVFLLLWLASRIYRVGMLMYGKRASIPEVLRWIRQA